MNYMTNNNNFQPFSQKDYSVHQYYLLSIIKINQQYTQILTLSESKKASYLLIFQVLRNKRLFLQLYSFIIIIVPEIC